MRTIRLGWRSVTLSFPATSMSTLSICEKCAEKYIKGVTVLTSRMFLCSSKMLLDEHRLNGMHVEEHYDAVIPQHAPLQSWKTEILDTYERDDTIGKRNVLTLFALYDIFRHFRTTRLGSTNICRPTRSKTYPTCAR